MNNLKEILDDLRNITMLTGEISKIHESSLRQWPYVLFDQLQGVEIKYDLTKQYTQEVGEGYVKYSLTLPDDIVLGPEDFKKKCDILTDWVRDLFWKEIKVEVSTKLEGYTNSSKTSEANPKQFKQEKSYSELFKEVKNGPNNDRK